MIQMSWGDTTPEMVVVRQQMDRLGRYPVDRTALERHATNLSRLSERLRRMGMPDRDVAGHVLGIFCAFERSLADTFNGDVGHA